LALFLVVAGGSAIAANQLAKNSVGTKQTANKANDASHANSADQASNANSLGGAPASAYAKNQLEAVHVVGAPGEPVFEHGCSNVGAFGLSAFILPVGFRPTTTESVVVVDATGNATSGLIRVDPSGAVVPFGLTQHLINSVSFRTN
jgi:hypothetical protein